MANAKSSLNCGVALCQTEAGWKGSDTEPGKDSKNEERREHHCNYVLRAFCPEKTQSAALYLVVPMKRFL